MVLFARWIGGFAARRLAIDAASTGTLIPTRTVTVPRTVTLPGSPADTSIRPRAVVTSNTVSTGTSMVCSKE